MTRGPRQQAAAQVLRLLVRREYSQAEITARLAARLKREQRLQALAAAAVADSQGAEADPADPTEALDAAAQAGAERGQHAAAVAEVLADYAARGLQSDARVAETVLASHARRHGSRRLAQTLRAKGLAESLVAESLAQVQGTEFERALALWRRRFGSHSQEAGAPQQQASRQEQARQMRFLLARGFSSDVVRRVLRSAGQVEAGIDPEADVDTVVDNSRQPETAG